MAHEQDRTAHPQSPPGLDSEGEEPTGFAVQHLAEHSADQLLDAMPEEDDRTAVVSTKGMGRLGRQEPKDRSLLVRVKGAGLGQVTRLGDSPCTIGRSSDANLYVGDDGVSRKHALLIPNEESYVLVDLESANGTFVSGQRIARHLLKDGDLIQFGPAAAFRYTRTEASQEALLRQLFETSVTDALTGAFNRDHLDTQLKIELSYARRHKTDVSLVLIDIDHFKKVNDTFGHQAGDHVLSQIARTVSSAVRQEDVFARYGGEEFAVVLRGIDLAGAAILAERLRSQIEETAIPTEHGVVRVTISAGCSTLSALSEPTPDALIGAADARLYAAKRSGRNRINAAS